VSSDYDCDVESYRQRIIAALAQNSIKITVMNARLVHFKSGKVRAEYELTQCGGCSTGIWFTIGDYATEKGARIATAARARSLETYIRWCSPLYIDK